MKNLLSSVAIIVVLAALGLSTVIALPRGIDATAAPAQAPSIEVANAPDAPTATQNYNAIGLPLDVQSNWTAEGYSYDADGLADYIGTSVQQVLRLDASRQDFDSWFPATQDGFVGGVYTTTPYPLATGGNYWVLVDSTSPTVVSFVGDVPAQGSVTFTLVGTSPTCSNNGITLPLDQSSVTNADELASSIGATNVDQVLQLNAARQDFDSWFPATQDGFVNGVYTTTPFAVKIGYPYWVCAQAGANGVVWP